MHPTGFRTKATLASPSPDQFALELGQASKQLIQVADLVRNKP
jgi:hypothetical protein